MHSAEFFQVWRISGSSTFNEKYKDEDMSKIKLGLICILAVLGLKTSAITKSPNIIMIMSDDQGWGDGPGTMRSAERAMSRYSKLL